MSFSDLKYGWHQEIFDLVDVSISRSVQLLEKGEDGEWRERHPGLVISSDKFDDLGEIKFSRPTGSLKATAHFPDIMDQMIFGVPESRESRTVVDETRIESIEIWISAEDIDDDLKDSIKCGGISYDKRSEDMPTSVYAHVFISNECFEDICRLTSEPDTALQLALNIKSWRWIGPIGDSKTYINTDEVDKAEFASLTVSRKIPNSNSDGAS